MAVQTMKRENYRFEARDLAGKLRQGNIEASSREKAIEKLNKANLSYVELTFLPYGVAGEDEIEKASDPVKIKPYAKIRLLSETLKEYQSPYYYLAYIHNICLVFAWFLIVVSVIFVLIGIGVAITHTESSQYASGLVHDEPKSSNAVLYFAIAAGLLLWSFLLHVVTAFFRGFASLCASTNLSADLLIAAIHRLDDIEGRILEFDDRR